MSLTRIRRLGIVCAALLACTAPAGTAQATAPNWTVGPGVVVAGTGHHGIMIGPDGSSYLCAADGEGLSPTAVQTLTASMSSPRETTALEVTTLSETGDPTRRDRITDSTQLGRIAWLAATANQTNAGEAAASQIAIVRAAGMYAGSIYEEQEKGTFDNPDSWALNDAIKRSEQVLANAKREAGPYSAQITMAAPKPGAARISGVGVRSASGTWLARFPYSIRLTGPATFADGSVTAQGTTAAKPINLDITPTGDGTVSASLTIEKLPSDKVFVSTGTVTTAVHERRAQNLILLGKTTSVTAAASIDIPPAPFTPVITTKAHSTSIEAGQALVDTVTVSAESWSSRAGAPIPVVVDVDVFGPFSAPQEPTTEGDFSSHLLGTYSLTFTGPGTLDTPGNIAAPSEGFYTFRARVTSERQGENSTVVREATQPYFEEAETTLVPWTPRITTQASRADGSDLLRDMITVTGFPEDHTEFAGLGPWEADATSIEHSIYFVPRGTEIVEGMTESMVPLATLTTPARNGDYTIEHKVDWSADGTYIVVSRYAGDSRTSAVRTSELEKSEHVPSTPPPTVPPTTPPTEPPTVPPTVPPTTPPTVPSTPAPTAPPSTAEAPRALARTGWSAAPAATAAAAAVAAGSLMMRRRRR